MPKSLDQASSRGPHGLGTARDELSEDWLENMLLRKEGMVE